ncbi:B3 domain-containing protein REM10-like isoform X2 [Lycium barbarum]|nr:B3 domain-containing protein REM10-like isoform X2 [Lycium barbarum]XP_060179538.1 B3 domain-containing protein REM10-like isoform X2 [Lycium barbarum]
MLVFRHEGNMEFEITIFDSSHCDREYAEYLQEEKEAHTVEETCKKFEFKDKPNSNIMSTRKAFPKEESATYNSFGQSHFKCPVRSYFLSKGYLRLPKKFATANGLINKKSVIIRDGRQRSWNLRLATHNSIVHVGGVGEFCIANDLKEGDYMSFEVVANGEKPIWKFHVIDLTLKTLDVTTRISQIPASTSADANPHFISTIKPYTPTKAILYLPMDFVKLNGLMNRSEMILVDEKQRLWLAQLGRMQRHFGITSGWRQFEKANGVQVGDTYKFELINNGTIPIVHFHCKYTGKGCQVSQKPLTRE